MKTKAKERGHTYSGTEPELDDKYKKFEAPAYKGRAPIISPAAEIRMWNYISQRMDTALAAYPTTLQEDEELLDQDDAEQCLFGNERTCVLYRLGEK